MTRTLHLASQTGHPLPAPSTASFFWGLWWLGSTTVWKYLIFQNKSYILNDRLQYTWVHQKGSGKWNQKDKSFLVPKKPWNSWYSFIIYIFSSRRFFFRDSSYAWISGVCTKINVPWIPFFYENFRAPLHCNSSIPFSRSWYIVHAS